MNDKELISILERLQKFCELLIDFKTNVLLDKNMVYVSTLSES